MGFLICYNVQASYFGYIDASSCYTGNKLSPSFYFKWGYGPVSLFLVGGIDAHYISA